MNSLFSEVEAQAIVQRAKKAPYRHKDWFLEGNKTVYDAVEYFVKSGDFYLDVARMFPLSDPCMGWTVEETIDKMVAAERYNEIVIRHSGREKGSDRGKLKVMLYALLQEKQI